MADATESLLNDIQSTKESLERNVESLQKAISANVSEVVKIIGSRVEKTVFGLTDGMDHFVAQLRTGLSIRHQVEVRPVLVFGLSVTAGVLLASYGPARLTKLAFRIAVSHPLVQNAILAAAFGLVADRMDSKKTIAKN